MSLHDVNISAPTLQIGKADVVFDIKQDGKKLGALHISHGAIVWFPLKAPYGRKLTWSQLDSVFDTHGTRKAEKRAPIRKGTSRKAG